MTTDNLTAARLREVLEYNPETGVFTWIKPSGRRVKVGDVAGARRPDKPGGGGGYRTIQIDGTRYYAHRLVWFYMTGEWPAADVDHRFGMRDDNRWSELREASRSVNLQNQRTARGRVGLLGVCEYPAGSGKFRAQISAGGKCVFLGTFLVPEHAHAAYVEAKRRMHAGCTI